MMSDAVYERALADVRQARTIIELQSLRGIAALIVVVYHCGLYYDYGATGRSAMSAIFNAHAAVVTFFVLSGFVLTLSLIRTPLDLRRIGFFYIRRAFRIYPALWAACLVALCYLLLFGSEGTALGSEWARNNCGQWPLSLRKIVASFAGLNSHLPLPIWSLAIELIASGIMPFLILAMRRSVIGFLLLVAGLAVMAMVAGGGLLLASTYLVDFGIGAAIALAAPMLRRALRSDAMLALCAGGGLVLLWSARTLVGADYVHAYDDPATAILEGLGAALLIGAIYVRADRFPVLSSGWATRLGDRSYSLYLLHQPALALLAATGALVAAEAITAHPGVATLVLVATTLAVTLPLSAWAFTRIELPAVAAGQRCVRMLDALFGPRRAALSGHGPASAPLHQNLGDAAGALR